MKSAGDQSIYDALKDVQIKRGVILSKIVCIINIILEIYPDAKEIMGVTSFFMDPIRSVNSKYYKLYKNGLNLNGEWSQGDALNDFISWLDVNVPGLYDVISIYTKALKYKDSVTMLTKDEMTRLNAINNIYKNKVSN